MRRTSPSFRHLGLLACLAVFPAPAALHAEDVRVTVVAIHATDRDKVVDEDLRAIADKVQKSNPQLTGFRKGRITALKLGVGGKEEAFPLADNESVTVKVDDIIRDKKLVQVTANPPTLKAITYTAPFAKFFPIVTGYETRAKERLIVAIMVEER
jgi:hypothetical protein